MNVEDKPATEGHKRYIPEGFYTTQDLARMLKENRLADELLRKNRESRGPVPAERRIEL